MSIRRSRRVSLFEEQNGLCFYCGARMVLDVERPGKQTPDYACTEDHLVPKSVGGSDARDNVVAACFGCNNRRGTIRYDAFRWFVRTYGRNEDPLSVYRRIDRSSDEYRKNIHHWGALLKPRNMAWLEKEYQVSGPIISGNGIDDPLTPTKANPDLQVLAPKWKERRKYLTLARREIADLVYGIPYYERNAIWLEYLKKEKVNAEQHDQHG